MCRGFEHALQSRPRGWPRSGVVWLLVAGSLLVVHAPVRAQGGGDVFNCTLTGAWQLPGLVAPTDPGRILSQNPGPDAQQKLKQHADANSGPNPHANPAPEPLAAPGELLAVDLPFRHFMVDRRSGRAWSDAGPLVPETWTVEVEDVGLRRANGVAAPYRALMRDPAGALSLFTVVEPADSADADPASAPTLRPLFARYPARWLTDRALWLAVCRLIPARVQE